MDVNWMLKVVSDFNAESAASNMPALLKGLINTHQQYMQQPDDQQRSAFEKAKNTIANVLNDSVSNKYTPSITKIAKEVGVYDLMGVQLLNAIEIRLANSMPQAAMPELQKILKDYATKQQHCTQVSQGLTGLGVEQASIPAGQVQLNYIIPDGYKNRDYNAFIKANKEMLYIIDAMNHVTGHGASQTEIVSTRSGSFLMALLSNLDTIESLLNVVKTIMEIIGITATAGIAIHQMQKSGFSQKAIDVALADKEEIFDRKIDKLKEELQHKYAENNDGNNENFHIKINNSVNILINAAKDGIQLEAIASPSAETEGDDESNPNTNVINDLSVQINQLSPDAETIKNLPSKKIDIEDSDI